MIRVRFRAVFETLLRKVMFFFFFFKPKSQLNGSNVRQTSRGIKSDDDIASIAVWRKVKSISFYRMDLAVRLIT